MSAVVTNFSPYRNRNKPQAYRIGLEAQERKKALAVEPIKRDLTKWRKRLEQEAETQRAS